MQHGDLLFTQVGNPSNAISDVTEGYKGARVDHVGIVVKNHRGLFVLEAYPPEVRLTNLMVHKRRSSLQAPDGNPRYIQARLKPAWSHLLPDAIDYGLAQRNLPYDRLYLTDEHALYCSELVVDMFRHANDGLDFFPENPMSFRDLETGEILPEWVDYYSTFGMKVPAGEPGSNPGDISKDERLDIIQIRGMISGLQ